MALLAPASTRAAVAAPGLHAAATTPAVVATGLANPRHLSVGPDGAIYVTEAGIGGAGDYQGNGPDCVATTNHEGDSTFDCLGTTGKVDRISVGGQVSTVLSGLESVLTEPVPASATHSGFPDPGEVGGVSDARIVGGKVDFTMQDVDLVDDGKGTNAFVQNNKGGTTLGKLLVADPGSALSTWTTAADLAAYAGANPQAASGPSLGHSPGEDPQDSDPYAVLPLPVPAGAPTGSVTYKNALVVDAAANAVRLLTSTSPTIGAGETIANLASLPYQTETPPPGSLGPNTPSSLDAQAVPTQAVIGPDGSAYVSILRGVPSNPGTAGVYRVTPTGDVSLYASGFSAVTALAFDTQGRLLVLEYAKQGLLDRNPADGDLVRVAPDGTQTTLASNLPTPTGLAVTKHGIFVATGGNTGPASTGQVIEIANDQPGYRLGAGDGGVFAFGQSRFLGSGAGVVPAGQKVAAFTSDPVGPGYWEATANGAVLSIGAAPALGGVAAGTALKAPIVGMAPTPDGNGYWLVASDGGVFTYGDAAFYGSTGNIKLNKPVVGIAPTADGLGYWLVASDGGVFSYGDAGFHGSTGNITLNKPVVGGTATPGGGGYWLVAADGGVFAFGDAGFYGSTGNIVLNKPVVALEPTPSGTGYWFVATDGGVFAYGDAGFYGSTGNITLVSPVVGVGG